MSLSSLLYLALVTAIRVSHTLTIKPRNLLVSYTEPLRAATAAFERKSKKYGATATANRLGFLPLIFESSGRPHLATADFLSSLASDAEQKLKIPSASLYSYFTNRLSFTIQSSLAQGLIKRSISVNSTLAMRVQTHHTLSREFTITHDQFTVNGVVHSSADVM